MTPKIETKVFIAYLRKVRFEFFNACNVSFIFFFLLIDEREFRE